MEMIAQNHEKKAHGVLVDDDGATAAWIDGHKVTAVEWFLYKGVANGTLHATDLMAIGNAMARAAAMAELDAWGGVEKDAKVIDKGPRGTLLAVEWLQQRLLRVVCPSTGQVYFLGVPAATMTVTEGQAFINKHKGTFHVES